MALKCMLLPMIRLGTVVQGINVSLCRQANIVPRPDMQLHVASTRFCNTASKKAC